MSKTIDERIRHFAMYAGFVCEDGFINTYIVRVNNDVYEMNTEPRALHGVNIYLGN